MNTTADYLASLMRHAEASATTTADAQTASQWREQNRPLIDRLRDLLRTIPIEVQREGLALRDLQVRLKGRGGRNCNHAELGDCLRTLGFRRERRWRQAEQGFRAVWRLQE